MALTRARGLDMVIVGAVHLHVHFVAVEIRVKYFNTIKHMFHCHRIQSSHLSPPPLTVALQFIFTPVRHTAINMHGLAGDKG